MGRLVRDQEASGSNPDTPTEKCLISLKLGTFFMQFSKVLTRVLTEILISTALIALHIGQSRPILSVDSLNARKHFLLFGYQNDQATVVHP